MARSQQYQSEGAEVSILGRRNKDTQKPRKEPFMGRKVAWAKHEDLENNTG